MTYDECLDRLVLLDPGLALELDAAVARDQEAATARGVAAAQESVRHGMRAVVSLASMFLSTDDVDQLADLKAGKAPT